MTELPLRLLAVTLTTCLSAGASTVIQEKITLKNHRAEAVGVKVIFEGVDGTCESPIYDGTSKGDILRAGEELVVDPQGGAACWLWVPEANAPIDWKQDNWCPAEPGTTIIDDSEASLKCRGSRN